ncbi:hypothetical protein HDU76_012564, partial [Blyttiomyces sp. JEL0837]
MTLPATLQAQLASSSTLQPQPSSLWDFLAEETKNDIFSFCDPLTLHLNGRSQLNDPRNQTEIWTLAFEMGWSGDLTLLPMASFPNAFNGLCKVTSRDLYERLRILLPDLDHQVPGLARDMINILVKNHRSFGEIRNISTNPLHPFVPFPITLVKEDDELNSDGIYTSIFGVSTADDIVKCLDSILINIPLRMCWIDIFECNVRQNPIMMTMIAISMNPFELLKLIMREMKLVHQNDILRFSQNYQGFHPYILATAHGNLEMIKFFNEQRYPIPGNERYVIDIFETAIQLGDLMILDYLDTSVFRTTSYE